MKSGSHQLDGVLRKFGPVFAVCLVLGLVGWAVIATRLGKSDDPARQKNTAADLTAGKIGDSHVFDIGNGSKLTLKYVPGGRFMVGSPKSEVGRYDNEHLVTVEMKCHYWLAETEVTQGQWDAVMGKDPIRPTEGGDLPIKFVSWDDAWKFIGKLNALGGLPSGWKWSLPTEPQWERACRGGTTGAYAGEVEDMAWHKGNAGGNAHAVGTKTANAYGLYDMHGNVWEWCADGNAGGICLDGRDVGRCWQTRKTSSVGSSHVVRGGNWDDPPRNCRSAAILWLTFDSKAGFRVAAVPAGP